MSMRAYLEVSYYMKVDYIADQRSIKHNIIDTVRDLLDIRPARQMFPTV